MNFKNETQPRIKELEKDCRVEKVRIQKKMAGVTRLELAAFCVTGRRYNQLNYTPAESV